MIESDIWNMDIYIDETLTSSFKGKIPRHISEVLIGVKKYMEDKTNEINRTNNGTVL